MDDVLETLRLSRPSRSRSHESPYRDCYDLEHLVRIKVVVGGIERHRNVHLCKPACNSDQANGVNRVQN